MVELVPALHCCRLWGGYRLSLYILRTFGRTDGSSLGEVLMSVVVLGFPAAVGAAAVRLIL